jgi:hypothetical protein
MRMILASQRVGSERKPLYLVVDRGIRSRQALDILRYLYGVFGVTALGSKRRDADEANRKNRAQ